MSRRNIKNIIHKNAVSQTGPATPGLSIRQVDSHLDIKTVGQSDIRTVRQLDSQTDGESHHWTVI